MKVPVEVLLRPFPQSNSEPLLTTVFRVLKAVATGTPAHTTISRSADGVEADPPLDNVGENLSTRSPPQSPVSSPIKSGTVEGFSQRSPNVKTTPTPGEAEANIRSVRLAAKMVIKNRK